MYHHSRKRFKEGLTFSQVRQIMKKWADLKCDGKRRIVALRGPNGSNLRKKNLGPVERMVHKILMMSPRGGEEKQGKIARHVCEIRFYKKMAYFVCLWFNAAVGFKSINLGVLTAGVPEAKYWK